MCQGKTLKGRNCKNLSVKGSKFCSVHGGVASPKKSQREKDALAEVVEAQRIAEDASAKARLLYENYVKQFSSGNTNKV
jgi:hypothetical protein